MSKKWNLRHARGGAQTTHARGEKCATALLTEMEVGNEMPGTVAHERRDPVGEKRAGLTLRDPHALDRLAVHRAGARLEKLVALEAEIDHLRALDTQLDELFRDLVDDVGRRLEHD